MRFSAASAAFSALLLADCSSSATGTGGAINAAAQIGVAAINTALEGTPGKKIEIVVNMQPSLAGEPLQVGLPVVVGIDPVLPSGAHCYSCVIHWHSDKRDRAAWTDFKEVGGRKSPQSNRRLQAVWFSQSKSVPVLRMPASVA